jgi:hypothetical protein
MCATTGSKQSAASKTMMSFSNQPQFLQRNIPMKYAIEFQFDVYEDKTIEPDYDTVVLLGDEHYLSDTYDFDIDYWDWFRDEDSVKKLGAGRYHVFAYGNVTLDGGLDSWGEYDLEIIFEPEYTKITPLQ